MIPIWKVVAPRACRLPPICLWEVKLSDLE
jgi:hypothetical protein